MRLRSLVGVVAGGCIAVVVWMAFWVGIWLLILIGGRELAMEDNSVCFVISGIGSLPLVFLIGAVFGWLFTGGASDG